MIGGKGNDARRSAGDELLHRAPGTIFGMVRIGPRNLGGEDGPVQPVEKAFSKGPEGIDLREVEMGIDKTRTHEKGFAAQIGCRMNLSEAHLRNAASLDPQPPRLKINSPLAAGE